jgi:hypothetical protein
VYHLKEWNTPMWANAEGRYSVKGTEVIASIWQTSEANALKDALARVQEHFDRHPEWQAFTINAVHDEIDAESRNEVSLAVANVVFNEMRDGLVRAGGYAIWRHTRTPRNSELLRLRIMLNQKDVLDMIADVYCVRKAQPCATWLGECCTGLLHKLAKHLPAVRVLVGLGASRGVEV